MQIAFTVHSCVQQPFPVQVPLGDKTVEAQVPGLVVELLSADGAMSHTLKFVPDDMEAAKAELQVGASVSATYAPAA